MNKIVIKSRMRPTLAIEKVVGGNAVTSVNGEIGDVVVTSVNIEVGDTWEGTSSVLYDALNELYDLASSGQNLTYEQGLINDGGVVKLGGTMSENRTITGVGGIEFTQNHTLGAINLIDTISCFGWTNILNTASITHALVNDQDGARLVSIRKSDGRNAQIRSFDGNADILTLNGGSIRLTTNGGGVSSGFINMRKVIVGDAEDTSILIGGGPTGRSIPVTARGLGAMYYVDPSSNTYTVNSIVHWGLIISQISDTVGNALTSANNYTNTQIANIDFPVDSVNGQTGVVVLNASNVGADPVGTAQALANEVSINVNFQSLTSYDFIAPFDFQIDNIDKNNSETVTLELNSNPYTLGDPIDKFDTLTINVTGDVFVILGGNKI
jgi:hypothetical protein